MKDKIHDAVKRALEKEGWQIVNDPFYLKLQTKTVRIDMEAERFMEAKKGAETILIEVKTLDTSALLYSFYAAYGQYEFYRDSLAKYAINKPIYLATSERVHYEMNAIPELMEWLKKHKVNLLFVDIEEEKIETWITY